MTSMLRRYALRALGGSVGCALVLFGSAACQSGPVQASDYELAEEEGCLVELDNFLNCSRALVDGPSCEVSERIYLNCACPSDTCKNLTGRTSGNSFCGDEGEVVGNRRDYSYRGYECSCRINSEDRFGTCNLISEPEL